MGKTSVTRTKIRSEKVANGDSASAVVLHWATRCLRHPRTGERKERGKKKRTDLVLCLERASPINVADVFIASLLYL